MNTLSKGTIKKKIAKLIYIDQNHKSTSCKSPKLHNLGLVTLKGCSTLI